MCTKEGKDELSNDKCFGEEMRKSPSWAAAEVREDFLKKLALEIF